MASNINPYNIDGTFPIANQDNSSQGFRDNFTNIRNNLIYAENEITDLQTKALVTSALNGQTLSNDMAGTQIRRPQLASWTESFVDLGAVSGTATLDFNQGNFQKITTAGSITLNFTNWSAGFGLMRVWIVVTTAAHTITTPSAVSIGIGDIAGAISNVDGTYTITPDISGNYIFEFGSIDTGATYQIVDLLRNRSTQAGGQVVTGYQYLGSPSTNFWANISTNKSRLIIDPTTTLAAGNVTLPNVTVDGTIISVHSTAQITTFGANSRQTGTVVKPSATFTLSAGTGAEYFYHAVENTWYKIR